MVWYYNKSVGHGMVLYSMMWDRIFQDYEMNNIPQNSKNPHINSLSAGTWVEIVAASGTMALIYSLWYTTNPDGVSPRDLCQATSSKYDWFSWASPPFPIGPFTSCDQFTRMDDRGVCVVVTDASVQGRSHLLQSKIKFKNILFEPGGQFRKTQQRQNVSENPRTKIRLDMQASSMQQNCVYLQYNF